MFLITTQSILRQQYPQKFLVNYTALYEDIPVQVLVVLVQQNRAVTHWAEPYGFYAESAQEPTVGGGRKNHVIAVSRALLLQTISKNTPPRIIYSIGGSDCVLLTLCTEQHKLTQWQIRT